MPRWHHQHQARQLWRAGHYLLGQVVQWKLKSCGTYRRQSWLRPAREPPSSGAASGGFLVSLGLGGLYVRGISLLFTGVFSGLSEVLGDITGPRLILERRHSTHLDRYGISAAVPFASCRGAA